MTLHWDSKKPGETDDRDLDWSQRLDAGDSIVSSSWAVVGAPTSLTLGVSTHTDTLTKIVLSGGRPLATYTLKNTITPLLGSSPLYEFVEIEIEGM